MVALVLPCPSMTQSRHPLYRVYPLSDGTDRRADSFFPSCSARTLRHALSLVLQYHRLDAVAIAAAESRL
jgi:hypothetical protein